MEEGDVPIMEIFTNEWRASRVRSGDQILKTAITAMEDWSLTLSTTEPVDMDAVNLVHSNVAILVSIAQAHYAAANVRHQGRAMRGETA